MRCESDERNALDQPWRCIAHPALANEQVQRNAAGQVVLKPKTSWHDDTTHMVMSPLEFMRLRIELPLCGKQIDWCYVGKG